MAVVPQQSLQDRSSESGSTASNLLRAAQANDQEAWRQLVGRYSPLIFWWALRSGLKDHDAADVVQTVCAKLSVALAAFEKDGRPGSFRRWLKTITRDKIARFREAEAKQPLGNGGSEARKLLDQVPDEPPPSTCFHPPVDPRRERFWELVDRLEDEFQESTWEAFWLTMFEDCTSAEAGTRLGMTDKAVRLAKGRVLRRLREEAAALDIELSSDD
jgi:RNA polymerase sigma-70 factor, ECF subfamily